MRSSAPPIRFCFGLHLHQPVGNFGYVFEQHVRDVYLPFLERLSAHGFFPIALHISGPLIEWLEANDTRYLDLLGKLAAEGRVELLGAGFYEPILASLPRRDRVEQVQWLQDALTRLFGVRAQGVWLTERVWEPDLAADLHDAGIAFALVDDRHFLTSGFSREQLHRPHFTEHDGKRVALFPIDEKLRYLVPFQPPEDTATYLRQLRSAGHGLAVLADDGEKFGGWPGTREWVFEKGWLDRFLSTMDECLASGDVVLSSFADALAHVPSGGLAYLGTASYREMESWSLPAAGAMRLTALEETLGTERVAADGEFLRGAHWRNFLVKYAEANRMHKKMLVLSQLCHERGDPQEARRAIGRAQCNDAYWHGVFGGLYLPFLRAAVWGNLARAEQALRVAERLSVDVLDLDRDGNDEIWIHSSHFSAIVSPHRGGAIEELTHFANEENLVDTLTRRREGYHVRSEGRTPSAELSDEGRAPSAELKDEGRAPSSENRDERRASSTESPDASRVPHADTSAPSIHDIEKAANLEELPPADRDIRAVFQERLVSGTADRTRFLAADVNPVISWVATPLSVSVSQAEGSVQLVMRTPTGNLEKKITFSDPGILTVEWSWVASAAESGCFFTTELSLTREVPLVCSPEAERWEYPIETVAKSEKGFDRTRQGTSTVLRWPISLGAASVVLPVPTRRVWD